MKPVDDCTTLTELLANGERWCQGPLARDAKGASVDPEDEDACKWCLYGGIVKLSSKLKTPREDMLASVYQATPDWNVFAMSPVTGIVMFNDHQATTFPQVQAVLDKAGW